MSGLSLNTLASHMHLWSGGMNPIHATRLNALICNYHWFYVMITRFILYDIFFLLLFYMPVWLLA